jgi:hypothetical protein
MQFTLRIEACALLAALCSSSLALARTYPPNTELTRVEMPTGITRPAYLSPIIDPVFNTKVMRIADRAAFNSTELRLAHTYAKNQPWNADSSLIMLNYTYPAAILDGKTYKLLRWIHQPSDAVWSNIEPYKMIGAHADMNVLVKADARTDWTQSTLHTFTEYDAIEFGAGEGNLSNDDRYIALFGLKGGQTDLLVYDLVADKVLARRSMGNAKVCDCDTPGSINNITMSQSGNYVIVEFNVYGRGPSEGIAVYDRNLTYLRNVSSRGGSHYDACYDAAGGESVVVQADESSAVVSARLDNGAVTEVLKREQMNYGIHISCRNLKRPGWAYISEFYFKGTSNATANYQEVFAVKLDGSGTVNRFAHEHHSLKEQYERAAMAVPNRDGTKVMWASDWENGSAPVYAYVAEAVATAQSAIVIDNANPGVRDARRTFTGLWCSSSASDKYGANFLYSCGAGADSYRWTPNLGVGGRYDVYVWWSAHPNRSSRVAIEVVHAAGTTAKNFNQKTGGGRWVLHGRYLFNPGAAGYVQVSDSNGQAAADAVRLVKVP